MTISQQARDLSHGPQIQRSRDTQMEGSDCFIFPLSSSADQLRVVELDVHEMDRNNIVELEEQFHRSKIGSKISQLIIRHKIC